MNLVDLLLALLVAAFVAVGARRGLAGLLLGVGAALALRPLLLLGELGPVAAVAAAMAVGLGIALLARWLGTRRPLSAVSTAILGGVGGAVLGVTLLLAAVVSLPVERNVVGNVVYPPTELPESMAPAVRSSLAVRLGRDILLYPLLERQGDIDPLRRPVLRALHGYLVVGEPWEER